MRAASREALGLFLTGAGGLAFLTGLAQFVNLVPTLGWLFGVTLVVGALLFVIAELRQDRNLVRAFLELIVSGSLIFGAVFGVMWYIMSYLPAHDGFNFSLMFETPSNTRNSFVSYLKTENFDKAYQLLSPDAQNQIPDAETFQRFVKGNNWQPMTWKWTTEKVDAEHAHYVGEGTYIDKRTGIIELWLDKIGNRWKISAMNFQPH